jgi:hypothetical protein
MYTRLIAFLVIVFLFSCNSGERGNHVNTKKIKGDYELTTRINHNTKIFFSGNQESNRKAYLEIKKNGIQIVLLDKGKETVLKTKNGKIDYPTFVKILKNGNYFRFWIGDITEWIRGPLGEWEGKLEPLFNEVYITTIDSFSIKEREWLKQTKSEVIKYGQDGSFYEQQIIPGAIINYNDRYYMYSMAGMKGNEEGASRRSLCVSVSDNLKDWKVLHPIIDYTDEYDNLYANGAVVTNENKVAILYSVQKFPEWKGFMLAIADNPEGPFKLYEHNPVYKHFDAAHEFDLVNLRDSLVEYEGKKYQYLLFFAGFTPKMGGDRGYLLYSNDLINWVDHKNNPIFFPETSDNWDAIHVRPRSLNKIGEYWYLWYEGCNVWNSPGIKDDLWCDVIGLARSKDLIKWEYHPRNPVLAGTGQNENICGHTWVGWPRMVLKNDTGYVFFCGSQNNRVSTTYRTIALEKLNDWNSDYLKKE